MDEQQSFWFYDDYSGGHNIVSLDRAIQERIAHSWLEERGQLETLQGELNATINVLSKLVQILHCEGRITREQTKLLLGPGWKRQEEL